MTQKNNASPLFIATLVWITTERNGTPRNRIKLKQPFPKTKKTPKYVGVKSNLYVFSI